MKPVSRISGFTLVEVLISLFIFSLISAGSLTALTGALRGKAQISEKLETLTHIETARALMRADMNALVIRQNRDIFGTPERTVLSGGIDSVLTFTRSGRDNPAGLQTRGDLQRVAYVFEDGQFIRRSLAHVNPGPDGATRDRVMVTDLMRAEMSYKIGEQTYYQIEIAPDDVGGYPERIQFTLTFKNGDILTQNFEVNL